VWVRGAPTHETRVFERAKFQGAIEMGIYDRKTEVQLLVAMLEAAQWNLQDGVIAEAAIAVEGDEILDRLDRDDIIAYIDAKSLSPEDLFDEDMLMNWAVNNFNSDPYGYEERERY
jgi:hypothetical protein